VQWDRERHDRIQVLAQALNFAHADAVQSWEQLVDASETASEEDFEQSVARCAQAGKAYERNLVKLSNELISLFTDLGAE